MSSDDDDFSYSGNKETLNPIKRPFNQQNSNSDSIQKRNRANNTHTIHLLIHRVFITYFARYLKRKSAFKKSVFLSNNPVINYNTFDKFEKNVQINKMLQDLQSLHGNDFLLKETSVPWLCNGAFIYLADIPEAIMSKFSSEPHRLRAINTNAITLKSKYYVITIKYYLACTKFNFFQLR